MDDFEARFLLLRDGDRSPEESWRDKPKGPWFEVSLVPYMEEVRPGDMEALLKAAAESGYRHALFHFRYATMTDTAAFDALLDDFFFPLIRRKVLGISCPLPFVDGTGFWTISLFHVSHIPPSETVSLTPGSLLRMLLAANGHLPVH